LHTRLRQSFPLAHVSPSLHLAHEPPQSTADSVPFCTPSLHVGAWQALPTQRRLLQSASLPHAEPGRQAGHDGPPQSIPDSPPFFTKSVHVGAWQVPVQTALVQSAGAPHP
jgi:hypothetical protein